MLYFLNKAKDRMLIYALNRHYRLAMVSLLITSSAAIIPQFLIITNICMVQILFVILRTPNKE